MKISEIYSSLQGEGSLTGTPSIFVRVSGCNLRCWFCDTPYASWKPEGSQKTIEEITSELSAHDARHLVITGGEPLLFGDLSELCEIAKTKQYHITIETAGTIYQSLKCDLMSISPKLENSTPPESRSVRWSKLHEERRYQPGVIKKLINEYEYQMKFVIDEESDVREAIEYIEKFNEIDRAKVWFMPQGVVQTELLNKQGWLVSCCQEHGVNYCPRKHIEWYGNKRGT